LTGPLRSCSICAFAGAAEDVVRARAHERVRRVVDVDRQPEHVHRDRGGRRAVARADDLLVDLEPAAGLGGVAVAEPVGELLLHRLEVLGELDVDRVADVLPEEAAPGGEVVEPLVGILAGEAQDLGGGFGHRLLDGAALRDRILLLGHLVVLGHEAALADASTRPKLAFCDSAFMWVDFSNVCAW
jgi:hypothetical protein